MKALNVQSVSKTSAGSTQCRGKEQNVCSLWTVSLVNAGTPKQSKRKTAKCSPVYLNLTQSWEYSEVCWNYRTSAFCLV